MILIQGVSYGKDLDKITERTRYPVPVFWNIEDNGVFFAIEYYFHPIVFWRIFRF
jgi:hypothetical protein